MTLSSLVSIETLLCLQKNKQANETLEGKAFTLSLLGKRFLM